jgi:hypothetical protein
MWLISASIAWAALGYFAFTFRILQFRAYPRGGDKLGEGRENESREA